MAVRFLPSARGDEELILELADRLDAFGVDTAMRARTIAPVGIGIHPPRGKKRRPLVFHYRDTIRATTFLDGKVHAGRPVSTPTFNPAAWAIATVVYTTATPWGHIYEVTGAGPHDIPIPISGGTVIGGFIIIVHHPGVSRRPHFLPALFEASASAGATMGGKVLSQRGHN